MTIIFKTLMIIGAALSSIAALFPTSAHAFGGFSSQWYSCGTACQQDRYETLATALIFAQWATAATYFSVSFILGLLVIKRGWKVGYTRKILALTLYITPFIFGYWWSIGFSSLAVSVSTATLIFCITLMSYPIRSRIKPLAIAFAAIDRPEDRPHTIAWLVSAIGATWLVLMIWSHTPNLISMVRYFGQPNIVYNWYGGPNLSLILLALFISGVGDALAEPVGLRFGRHKYSVGALWTDKKYTRSLEGSACVFISAVVGVLLVQQYAPGFGRTNEFILALILFPIVATIAEAFSPHTWDQPFIIGGCGLTAGVIGGLT